MRDYILKIANESVELPAPIKQRVDLNSLIIVRVYPSDEMLKNYHRDELNRNIYAYDLSGELVWQIQEAPHGGVEEDKAYMDIRYVDDKIVAGNWIGVDYLVDESSGVVAPNRKDVRPLVREEGARIQIYADRNLWGQVFPDRIIHIFLGD